ncbi:unnamed protein product [Parascedosporium putredinis]|uniref:Glycosyltransferase family 31 protein n=1 Tax=Parascedosporium putredinis TaxID=1442378 RepID=A0A9P1HBH0_9PEZI|nr:unnamed protein product [Parascedosporium putredinis]CAI8004928.1 unnamed protein product [Parascedosporium putredinis]
MGFLQNGRGLASYLVMPNTFQARRFIVLGSMVSLLLLIALWNQFSVDGPTRPAGTRLAQGPSTPTGKRPNPFTNPLDEVRQTPASIRQDPLCSFHPDTSKIAVVMKTGATESFARLPTQFMTTLRCIPDYLVFSDRKETIAGIQVMDTLDAVLPKAMEGNADFDLYRVQASCAIDQGPCTSALDRAEMGWNLDKYKNIHMAEKTWKMLPDKDCVALLGDIAFAHGGSGYLMSRAAMKDLIGGHPGLANRYDEDMHNYCCGDAVFAKAVRDTIDVNVTGVWPTINGEKPFTLPYGDSHWCHPIATMHHMSPEEISTFWEFETQFYADEAAEASRKDADKFVPSPSSPRISIENSSPPDFFPGATTGTT